MAVKEAAQRCPEGVYVADDPPRYAQAFEAVLDVLERFSPWWRTPGWGWRLPTRRGWRRCTAPTRRWGRGCAGTWKRATGQTSQVGLAVGRLAAEVAARGAGGLGRGDGFREGPGLPGRATGRPAAAGRTDTAASAHAGHRHDRRICRSAGERRADAVWGRGRAGAAAARGEDPQH